MANLIKTQVSVVSRVLLAASLEYLIASKHRVPSTTYPSEMGSIDLSEFKFDATTISRSFHGFLFDFDGMTYVPESYNTLTLLLTSA